MIELKFVITAVNKLTGQREVISKPMSREVAEMRLNDVVLNMKYKRNKSYSRLKVQPVPPIQLRLEFQN